MPPSQVSSESDKYFADTARNSTAYQQDSFVYVALKHEEKFKLLQGAILQNAFPTEIRLGHFTSENVRAGHFLLASEQLTAAVALQNLIGQGLRINGEIIHFHHDNSGANHAHYAPFWLPALRNQSRNAALIIQGAHQTTLLRQPDLDWELKASATPYDSLQELMSDYGLGALRNDNSALEVIAYNVAQIDPTSRVIGNKARIVVRLAKRLDTSKFSLGYRSYLNGQVAVRSQIVGADFDWEEKHDAQFGVIECDVAPTSVHQCFAIFDGVAQGSLWIHDPASVQNIRRLGYETYDRQLNKLKEILGRESQKGHDARSMEAASSWLLWMLGFSVINLNVARLQDNPDLIATSPSGHFLVVECTSGLLRADNKLSQLHDRAIALRRQLDTAGNSLTRVLPVIITTKTRSEVDPDIEQAEKWGILVLTKEDIEKGIFQSQAPANADQMYLDAEAQIRAGIERHETQSSLPGINPIA